MVFRTDSNIKKAKSLIGSGNDDDLYYACLELRYAIEKIAYQKLRQRLDKITIEEIASWQPKKALERLMDLVDEHLSEDLTLSIAKEDEYGVTPENPVFLKVGENKGVNPKEMGKHWQKLGSYLHIRTPQKKADTPEKSNATGLKNYLEEVIEYIEKLTSTDFDSFFSKNVTVKCSKCDLTIVRNVNLLKDGEIVQCQNSNCPASYIAHKKEGGNFVFEPYLLSIECKKCGQTESYEANTFTKMSYREARIATCSNCGSKHKVRWNLEYGFIDENAP